MKLNMKGSLLLLVLLMLVRSFALAQQAPTYSLRQLIDSATQNNHQLRIRHYQIQEKMGKLREDEIKRYPSATVDGSYQYNFRLPQISIPAGTIGSVTTATGAEQLLPSQASKFAIGNKGTYNVGINLYQPLTQQFKINTAIAANRLDIQLAHKEKDKAGLQLRLAIEQLYYGAVIAGKKQEAEQTKLQLSQARLYDAEGALTAGKSTSVDLTGLRADIAGIEQNVLKIDVQRQDYFSELERLTGLDIDGLELPGSGVDTVNLDPAGYKDVAESSPDMQIASLNKEKALLSVKAAGQGNLPDLGVVAGYYVQQGSPVLPASSPYVGISFKWNIQDLFSNREIKSQRLSQLRQAEEALSYTRQQIGSDIDKAWRKVQQSHALVSAAKKLVAYRSAALKEQQDKLAAGMEIKAQILQTQSQLAEAEADLYAAKLSSVLAAAELKNLTGQAD
jgi:outer membrane protein